MNRPCSPYPSAALRLGLGAIRNALSNPPSAALGSGWVGALALGVALGLAVPAVSAQDAPPAPTIEEPMSGFRAEYLGDMAVLRRKIVGLAEAIPAEVHGWRPAEGVRSTSEVFMHLAQTNVAIVRGLGHEIPEALEGELEERVEKEEVVATLNEAFRLVRTVVLETRDDALDESVEFFGRTWTRRALLYLAATHMHEHLGQAIAYARSNGVVPPWSAAAQAAASSEVKPAGERWARLRSTSATAPEIVSIVAR